MRNKIFKYVLTKDHHERKIMQADRQKIGKHYRICFRQTRFIQVAQLGLTGLRVSLVSENMKTRPIAISCAHATLKAT